MCQVRKFLQQFLISFEPYKYKFPQYAEKTSFSLSFQKEFSEDFLNYIGLRHITYYDNEFGILLKKFFQNYIEFFITNYYDEIIIISNLKEFNNDFNSLKTNLEQNTMYSFNRDKWHYTERSTAPNTPFFTTSSNSFPNIIQKIFNINSIDSFATVAKLLGLPFENFFSHQPIIQNPPTSNGYTKKCIEEFKSNYFRLLFLKEIQSYNEQILSKICSYQINNKYITLTASIKDNSIFAFGHTPPYATFYNFTQIDNPKNENILFFQNINQAFAYENILPKDYIQQNKFIITGHNSDKLEILDWSLLSHRRLLFICETKKKAYEELNLYKQYFEKYDISYTIFPYPLLFTELGFDCNKKPDVSKLSHIEQELLNNALYMDENINENYQTLWNKSLSFKNFIRWGTELGLFSKYPAEENYFEYSQLPNIENAEFEDNIHNIQLEKLILNNSITLLHAPAETGKSLFALSIAKALLSSRQFLFFKPSQIPPKILLLDGETHPATFVKRLKQLKINTQDENLLSISVLQEKIKKSNTLWSNLDLSKEAYRNQLTTFINSNNITFIIIDNISCLVPHNLSTEKLPQEIFNWLQILSQKCSILLIHHTKYDGSKVKGSQLWIDRTPNEIQLVNINNYKRPPKSYKELIKKYKPATGLFCGIQFNKCKSFPILQNKIFWVTLPIGACNWELLTLTDKTGNVLEDTTPSYNFPDLNPRENLILSKTKEKFTAKEVEVIIQKKRGTVLKCLNDLEEKGYIRKEGAIKSTYYIKTNKIDSSQAPQKNTQENNLKPIETKTETQTKLVKKAEKEPIKANSNQNNTNIQIKDENTSKQNATQHHNNITDTIHHKQRKHTKQYNKFELPGIGHRDKAANSFETKITLKDLAQELGVNIRELQKDCSKLNIEATKTNLLEDSDVQKIREYRKAHANDKIEQCETKSGVIVRSRKAEPKAESTAKLKTGTTIEQDKIKKKQINKTISKFFVSPC